MSKEYIEREALIEELKRRDFLPVIVKHAIEAVPAADVAPVRYGRWLTWEEQFPAHIPSKKSGLGVFCSTCHKHADNMYDYCPNCGAKMDGEEKSASDGGADNALRGDET